MKKTVLRPSFGESLFLILWGSAATSIAYVAYSSAWSLGYTGTVSSDIAVVSRFEPDASSVGLFIFSVLIFIVAFEVLGRSVTIEEESISSRSSIGFYRQTVRKAEIADLRITPILGWGRILEFKVNGRWVVFLANSKFKDRPHAYIGNAK